MYLEESKVSACKVVRSGRLEDAGRERSGTDV